MKLWMTLISASGIWGMSDTMTISVEDDKKKDDI